MTGIAGGSVEKVPVHDETGAHPGRHHHRQVVALGLRGADPSLSQCESLGVVVDADGSREALFETCSQREVTPLGDVQRRDRDSSSRHWATAPNTHPDRRIPTEITPTPGNTVDKGRKTIEQVVCIDAVGRHRCFCMKVASVIHDARSKLRSADVNCKDAGHYVENYADRIGGPDDDGGSVAVPDATGRAATFTAWFDAIVGNVARAIRGKDEAIRLVVLCLLSEGHLLLEDVPGVGKTTLAKALARSIDGTFGRIQFTPDLLPTDVLGVNVWDRHTNRFEFRAGPVFANIVVGDEINRASPKTQSALLEAMAERQVTIDGVTRPLPPPFVVIATENPVEHEGTYPLPDSQLDRFLMRVGLGYPDRADEIDILTQHGVHDPLAQVQAVVTANEVVALCDAVRRVEVAPSLAGYLVDIAAATRSHPDIDLGASPRATLALQRTAKALAAANGRSFVIPDDVKVLARPVLAHRILLSAEAMLQGVTAGELIDEVLGSLPVPTGVHPV